MIRPISYTSNKKSMTFQKIKTPAFAPGLTSLRNEDSEEHRQCDDVSDPTVPLPVNVCQHVSGFSDGIRGTHDLKNGKATFKKPNAMIRLKIFFEKNEGRSVLHVDNRFVSKKKHQFNKSQHFSLETSPSETHFKKKQTTSQRKKKQRNTPTVDGSEIPNKPHGMVIKPCK